MVWTYGWHSNLARECFVGLSILLVYGVILTNLLDGQVVDMAAPHIDDLQEREALEELSEETGIWDLWKNNFLPHFLNIIQ